MRAYDVSPYARVVEIGCGRLHACHPKWKDVERPSQPPLVNRHLRIRDRDSMQPETALDLDISECPPKLWRSAASHDRRATDF